MSNSKIEWTDKTWNIVTGCSPISEGCRNCYAKRMAKRLAGRYGYNKDDPFKVTWHGDKYYNVEHWRKPCRIFVCSMGDLFHNYIPHEWQNKAFRQMLYHPKHTFIILTKRPNNMADFIAIWSKDSKWPWPLPNVWLGVTAENQEQADKRIPILLQIPAAVKFVSVEPMLSPVKMSNYGTGQKIDWAICGAETGPGKRPMELQWAIDLHEQCEQAGVPFFFKKDSNGFYNPILPREWPKEAHGKDTAG